MVTFLLSKRERVRREAAGWIARLHGSPDPADRAAFDAWYAADPAHAEAYDRMNGLYRQVGALATTELGRRRNLHDERQTRRPARALAAALGVVVLLAISGALLIDRGGSRPMAGQTELLLFATAVGETRSVDLVDGSHILLEPQSAVVVELTRSERRLTLRTGAARFAVALRDLRPFVVATGAGRVVTRDAVFAVSLAGRSAEIRSFRGTVEVAPRTGDQAGPPVALAAGQTITINAAGVITRRQTGARHQMLWPKGMLDFSDAPLGQVLEQANRHGDRQIALSDPRLNSLRVTGAFRAGDAAGLARALGAALDLSLEHRGKLILLHPAAPADAR